MSRSYVSLLQKFRTLLTSNGKLVQKNKSSAMYLMLNAVCRFWLVFFSIFQAIFFCIHCKLEMRYEKRQTQSEKKNTTTKKITDYLSVWKRDCERFYNNLLLYLLCVCAPRDAVIAMLKTHSLSIFAKMLFHWSAWFVLRTYTHARSQATEKCASITRPWFQVFNKSENTNKYTYIYSMFACCLPIFI